MGRGYIKLAPSILKVALFATILRAIISTNNPTIKTLLRWFALSFTKVNPNFINGSFNSFFKTPTRTKAIINTRNCYVILPSPLTNCFGLPINGFGSIFRSIIFLSKIIRPLTVCWFVVTSILHMGNIICVYLIKIKEYYGRYFTRITAYSL